MSTQKGNNSRTRPQKHKNRSVFKNTLHDTSHQTKFINSIVVSNVCQRCKDIIEWKIKYKKYKPLTQAKKCIKCDQKNVLQAYTVMCKDCGKKLKLCTKCGESKEVVCAPAKTEVLRNDHDIQNALQKLPERKRRTFVRFMNNKLDEGFESGENGKDVLMEKLKSLGINDDEDTEEEDSDADDDSQDSDADDDSEDLN